MRAVDHDLQACDARGVNPDKPYSGTITVSTSPEVHRTIAVAAARANCSMNRWAEQTLAAGTRRSIPAALDFQSLASGASRLLEAQITSDSGWTWPERKRLRGAWMSLGLGRYRVARRCTSAGLQPQCCNNFLVFVLTCPAFKFTFTTNGVSSTRLAVPNALPVG